MDEQNEKKDELALAEEHWEWISSLIQTELLLAEKLFIDGFVHGWKHAKEE